jgi:hypothetical protein
MATASSSGWGSMASMSQGHFPWHMPVEQAKRAVASASIGPHDDVQEVVLPPCATQFVQQRQAVWAAQAFTWGQQLVLVHAVHGGSLAIGAQSTPPELDEDDVLVPLQGPPHCAATHALSACVVALGWGHCMRQVL